MINRELVAVRVLALGGLGEIGMNCLALEQGGEVLVIDCGVTFDHRGLGVDVVHPDFSALEPLRHGLRGVFLTHGHEDHIGALPYFLRRYDVPVWGTRYTLGLVHERAAEHEILRHVRYVEVAPRTRQTVGPFTVEPVRVTHSIADATALAIQTSMGTVVHTGDFKFDEAPLDGEHFDEARLRELGDSGVALLLSDSTGVDSDAAEAGSEAGVARALEEIVATAKGAVVVALFASNVHRLRALGDIAKRANRLIVPLGRSLQTHARVARATGYLEWPGDRVWPAERARELPRDRLLLLATGTQAEGGAALARLARGEHPAIDLAAGDTVVMSSRVIPGNEVAAFGVMGGLLRRGVELRTWYTDQEVHVSGHATRAEQQRMLELVRPRAFIPLHGTLHHLTRHAELARSLGVPSVQVLENGQTATLDEGGVRRGEGIHAGRVHVFAGRDIPGKVIKERLSLAAEGVAVVVVPVDGRGRVSGDVVVSTRGILDETHEAHVLAQAKNEARAAVDELTDVGSWDDPRIEAAARQAVRRTLLRVVGYRPNVVVTIVPR